MAYENSYEHEDAITSLSRTIDERVESRIKEVLNKQQSHDFDSDITVN